MKNLDYNFKDLKLFLPTIFVFVAFLLNIVSLEGLSFFVIMQLINLKIKINSYIKALIILIIGFLVYFFLEQNLKLEFLFMTIYLFITISEDIYIFKFPSFKIFSKVSNKNTIVLFLIFLFTILLQNAYIDYETIDWDINSYLVSSQNVSLNNLPYETQWESKQPLFFFFYKISIILSQDNLAYFKLLNDAIIFFLSISVYFITLKNINNKYVSFLSTLFYLLLMSPPWATAEYSEIYSLFFINLALLYLTFKEINNISYFLAGIFISISTMINIGTLIFVFFIFFFTDFKQISKKYLLIYILGLLTPVLLVCIVYIKNNLFIDFLYATFVIPANYPQSAPLNVKILIDFFRSYFEYNVFLFVLLIYTIINSLRNMKLLKNIEIALLAFSLMFIILASHGYFHHFIFLIYFVSFTTKVNFKPQLMAGSLVLFLPIFFTAVLPLVNKSLRNIENVNNLQNNYPLYGVSKLIEESSNKPNPSILSLDYHLVNYYLGVNNFSYIVHPTNHTELFITDKLISLNRIRENEISTLISTNKPDFIICSEDFENFNCEVSDWVFYESGNKVYIKVDVSKFNALENINYYKDPYKKIRLFKKINDS